MELLDIYYNIDVGNDQDYKFIEKCLEIYVKTNFRNYTLNKFINFQKNDKHESDIIKTGLNIFNEMFETLPLKNSYDTWFIFIGNGKIGDQYNDISVILLNKKPMIKKANYVINKNKLNVNTNYSKQEKLKGTRLLTNNLNHLFNSNKYIEYK